MRVIFLGPPGAGKGTQARRFSEEYDLLHISTGDLLRKTVEEELPGGNAIRSCMDRGVLVPDETVTEIVRGQIREAKKHRGFILDGFPRTPVQAESLEKILTDEGERIDCVVNFNTALEVVRERMLGRRVCSKCSANFHLKNLPPRTDGRCDRCGGELKVRPDDQNVAIEHRIKVFQERSACISEYYRKKGLLKTIPGETPAGKQYETLKGLFGLNSA